MLQILQHFYQINLTFSESELICCKFCNFELDKQAFCGEMLYQMQYL